MRTIREHPVAFALVMALLPGVSSWIAGRLLAKRLDDPSLPERLLFHQRRNSVLMVVAGTGIGVFTPFSLVWAGPLLLTALLLANYPLRRTLFGETWTAARYLWFFHRLIVGVFGFWIALAMLPGLASLAGSLDWLAGAAMAAALVVWERHYAGVVRACVRAAPLEEGPLLDRCRGLARAFGMEQPEYLRVDLRGGVIGNALALPSLRGNAVIFSDTLLSRLTVEEAAAICAHELAHFEHFNPGRLRRLHRVSLALIAGSALLGPGGRLAGVEWSALPTLVWFGAMSAAMLARAKDKQRQETICDQRAAEIMGDGEPMVSALIKIYGLARMPRRLEGRHEQASSHPSLARRIRDIRKAAGTRPSPLSEPVTIPGRDGSATVTFEPGALHWIEQQGLTHVLSYGHLTELRLEPHGRRGPRLRAATAAGRKWDLPIAHDDVARLQEVLDRIDGQLADTPAPRGVPADVRRLFVLFTSFLALSLGQILVAAIALLAWFVPGAQLLAAAGVSAIAATALVVRDHPASSTAMLALIGLSAGTILIWFGRQAHRGPSRNQRPLLAVLAAGAVLLLVSVGIGGLDPIQLHMAIRETPAVVVAWLSLSAALACSPGSRARIAGLLAAVVAAAATAISSPWFLDRFGHDPFLVGSQKLQWIVVDAGHAEDYEIPPATSGIQLSPSGLRIAALQQSESEDAAPTFQVGLPGSGLSPLSGHDLRFFDDDTLIILDADGSGSTVRQVRIDPPHQEVWRQLVPQLQGGTLSITRTTGHWRMNGFDPDQAIVRAEGTIGSSELRLRRWPPRYTRDTWIEALTTDGREPLVVESSYDNGFFDYLPSRVWAIGLLFNAGNRRSRYWSIGDTGVTALGASRLGASCTSGISSFTSRYASMTPCGSFHGSKREI